MIILSDLDGVIADWEKGFDELLDYYDPKHLVNRTKDQHDFDLFINRTEEQLEIIRSVMSDDTLYKNLEVNPLAIETLNKLVEEGHTVYIVTSPDINNPTGASDKLSWVRSELGAEWADRLVLTRDKTSVFGDILIDDKPEVVGALKPHWDHVIFDKVWNQHVPGLRVKGWEQVEVLINKLEERANEFPRVA